MSAPRFTRAGDRGVFVELGAVSMDELHAATGAVRLVAHSRGWIVGYSSLLGTFESSATTYDTFASAVRDALRVIPEPSRGNARTHSIPVSFSDADAPDLPLLLDHARLTRAEFLETIEGLTLRARFLGFLRGFAYLEGIPASWPLPRQATSRARVPAGSFAIAGAMAGFYPAESPGGWNLIGRTAMPLWDIRNDRPNVIAAGDEIRIRATSEVGHRVGVPVGEHARSPVASLSRSLVAVATVRTPGQLTRASWPSWPGRSPEAPRRDDSDSPRNHRRRVHAAERRECRQVVVLRRDADT